MDSEDRKADLKEAKRLLERTKELLTGCGEECLVEDLDYMLASLNESIEDADKQCYAEQRMENAALTRSFFQDAIMALNRL